MGASDLNSIGAIGPPQGRLSFSHRQRASTPTTSIRSTTRMPISCARRMRTRKIRSIDTAKAKTAPGVVAIFTGDDLTGVNGVCLADG